MLRTPEAMDKLAMIKKRAHRQENVLLKMYSNAMEYYTTQSSFSYAKSVQIQGHLSNENCLLLHPLKRVQSEELCGLWLNGSLARSRVHLNRAPFDLDLQLCIFLLRRVT